MAPLFNQQHIHSCPVLLHSAARQHWYKQQAPTRWQARQNGRQHRTRHVCCATEHSSDPDLSRLDSNQLQTALNTAIAGEDWKQAANLRDALHTQTGEASQLDWRQYGLPEWLADRVDRLGYRFPTGERQRPQRAV